MGRDSLTLKWTKPLDTGGVPLSGYIVEQQDGKSTRWRVAAYVEPSRTWWSAHGLTKGQDYNFRVRAENPDGSGPPSTLHARVQSTRSQTS